MTEKDRKEKFIQSINDGYTFKGETITLGAAILDKEILTGTHIKLPLKTMNRHGLIAGATGTGKTKTLQLITESLAAKSVPVVVMDIKGDLSGVAKPGTANPKVDERMQHIGLPWNPEGNTIEFLTISGEKGTRLRATTSEFGPVLFSRMLELNETQSSLVSVIFKYSDDKQLPLLDLADMKRLLQFIQEEGKAEFEASYGKVSSSSLGIILRKIVELEQQGANQFFGERSFEAEDLVRCDSNGRGVISVIRLIDMQTKPKLFSTFLLSLLAEIYATFPEEGDLDQPKLVIFIDEAHLLFNEASGALLSQIESIIKLIRSKGVGIFFCTQNPTDIPNIVLSQLGMKVQHALRAFTAKDRKDIKLISENYPMSEYYDIDDLLTSLGIGEAAVTVLSEKGNPTPLAATLLCAPRSRMDILTQSEIDEIIAGSKLAAKYNEEINRESALEILNKKLEEHKAEQEKAAEETGDKPKKEEKSTVEKVLTSTTARQVGRTVAREVTRGLLGVLGIGGTRRKKKSSWF
ncbi:MAG: ATPase [Chlorobi bacterium OLB5]|nr:MAG: ATPase [Chlorobi bacterium OLB5]